MSQSCLNWISANKDWLFDGGGLLVLAAMGGMIRYLWNKFALGEKTREFISERTPKRISQIPFNTPFSQIVRRARLLVVDDEEEVFPWRLMQKEGYTITYWENIQQLKPLEDGDYDVVILDINGVADKNISPTDGLGILDHVKRHNPAQLIIAYSGRKYDLSKQAFWEMADVCLGKPSPLTTCKEKIDGLLKNHFTPTHYWGCLEKKLLENNCSAKNIERLQTHICDAILDKREFRMDDLRVKYHLPAEDISLAATIIRTLFHIFGVTRHD